MKCVRAATVAVDDIKYYTIWGCVCNYMYPACNAHVLYCQLWSVPLYNIFPNYLVNETISTKKKKNLEPKMCVRNFCINFPGKFLLSKKKCARYDTNVHWSACKVSVILLGF